MGLNIEAVELDRLDEHSGIARFSNIDLHQEFDKKQASNWVIAKEESQLLVDRY